MREFLADFSWKILKKPCILKVLVLLYKSYVCELGVLPNLAETILIKKGDHDYGSKENSRYKNSSSKDRINR